MAGNSTRGGLAAQAFGRLKPGAKKASSTRAPVTTHPYCAASISFEKCTRPCDAVRGVGNTRFLMRSVPALPLRDCNSAACKCSYVRYNDRRAFGADRRALFNLNTDLHVIGGDRESRKNKGRRSGDDVHYAASDADWDILE